MRLAGARANYHIADFLGRSQILACLDDDALVALRNFSGCLFDVGELQRAADVQRRLPEGRQAFRFERHQNFAALSARQGHHGHVGRLLDHVVDLRGDAAQFVIAIPRTPQRQRDDRNVVDGAGLHHRPGCVRRKKIQIRIELIVEPNQTGFFIEADQVPDHD